MKKTILFFVLVLLIFGLSSCNFIENNNDDNEGTKTETFVPKHIANEDKYEAVIYVSTFGNDEANDGSAEKPYATLTKAKEEVQKINKTMTKDICVVVRGGTYYNTKTIEFGINDSGFNDHKIIYSAYPGEEVILAGGVKLKKWTKVEGEPYYFSSVKTSSIRYLFVDGSRATLARYPNGQDYTNITKWDRDNEQVLVKTSDLNGATSFETVFHMEWAETCAKVTSVTNKGDNTELHFADFEDNYYWNRGLHPYQTNDNMYCYYQNAMEFLDNPGEFYYDKEAQKLYYYPKENEDLTKVEVIVPVVDSVIKVNGSMKKNRTKNLVFNGLNVYYTTFSDFNKYGFMDDQSSHYAVTQISGTYFGYDVPKGAIHIQNASNIIVQNCTVAHAAGTGINFYTAVSNCSAVGNDVYDIGSTGIITGPFINGIVTDQNLYTPVDDLVTVNYVTIKNNYVHLTGVVFSSSSSVANMVGHHITITHNEICYGTYSGISNGWGWSLNDYACHDNIVSYNEVHHIGLNGSDLGGIYNLNNQKGSKIIGNYVHEIQSIGKGYNPAKSPCFGVYLDEGTNNMVVSDNQVAYCWEDRALIFEHSTGNDNTITNNKGVLNGDTLDQSIIDNAGLEDDYKYLVTKSNNSAYERFLFGGQGITDDTLIGFKFTANSNLELKGIGRFYCTRNTMVHKAYIYDSNKKLIASVNIVASEKISEDGYNYSLFDEVVNLESGKTYYIVGEESTADIHVSGLSDLVFTSCITFVTTVSGDDFTEVEGTNNSGYIPLF